MVKWSVPAKNDLKQIHDYIAKDSKYYAQNVIQEIVAKTEPLFDFPEIGRVVPEINDQNIRELLVYSYRLIYEIFRICSVDGVISIIKVCIKNSVSFRRHTNGWRIFCDAADSCQ